MCSNWKTMSTSARAGSVNSRASSTVTPGISPTVSSRPGGRRRPRGASRARNSWIRGPYHERGDAVAAQRARAARRRRAARGVLGDEVDDVHPEAVDARGRATSASSRRPPARTSRVLPVEVGLLAGEQVQVVLAGGLVVAPRPGRRRTTPSWSARRPASPGVEAGPRRPPPVPVALRVVRRRARLDEPRVLVGGVVDDEVHHEPHAAVVQRRRERVEVGRACRKSGRCPGSR